MTLTEILTEMQTQEGFQNADLTPQVINGTVPGVEIARVDALAIAKRQANERLEELRNLYDRTVYQTSVVIFVTGAPDKQKAFLEAATKEDAVCVQSDAFYRSIAAAAKARMSAASIVNTAVSTEIVNQLARALGEFAPNTFLQYPKMPPQYIDSVVKSEDELLAVVKATAKPTVEIPLNVTWLERNVANLAYAQKFAAEPLAVVVAIEDPADVQTWKAYFLPRCIRVVVDANEGTTEDQLQKAKAQLNEAVGS